MREKNFFRKLIRFIFIIYSSLSILFYYDEVQGEPIFVSLKSSEVNLRVGPGKEYPISWVFMRANLPMLLVAEFQQWRKVKFVDGTVGWVHKNMVSRRNSAIVTSKYAIMYQHASKNYPIAKIEKNVIVKILKKNGNWIKVNINNQKGWIERECLWGVNEEQ